MRMLNRQYRGIDRTTDVLSFPQQENYKLQITSCKLQNKEAFQLNSSLVLGDIIINLHQAKRQAAEHDLTFNEELRWLLIHGLLHLIGYEHEKSRYHEKKMRRKERELLNALE
jgi:probable rRNA maturation factor